MYKRQGIGKATAISFAELGAKVVISGRNEKSGQKALEEIKAAGGEASYFRADVSKEEDVKALVEFTVKTYGGLDHCFNNAGVDAPTKDLLDFTEEDFDFIVNVDLKGVFFCLKSQIAYMLKQGHGTIVNTSSVAGIVADPGMAPYVAAKHGVVGLTKAAGIEYIERGIRVNGIAPGFVATPMTQDWIDNPEMLKIVTDQTPIHRAADPSEMAGIVLYLSSNYSTFAAGQTFIVDGGQTAH